jgi:hypothetical protein
MQYQQTTIEQIVNEMVNRVTRNDEYFPVRHFPFSISHDPRKFEITEWDGSKNIVEVKWGEGADFIMQYEDGTIHEVSPAYFFNELDPKPISTPIVMHDEPRVRAAQIISGRYRNIVMVEFTDGSVEDVLSYYNDELSFCESEFIGKTKEQCHKMFLQKDIAY